MSLKQSKVIISGGIGLILCLAATAITLSFRPWVFPHLPAYLTMALMMWGVFLFLMMLALLEIPLMVYGMRKIVEGENSRLVLITLSLNSFFVFFPVVYAMPNLLMGSTAQLWMGLTISATAVIRWIVSSLFLPSRA